ncbi:hypothetical protein HDU91_005159 [Kappamyces sp. JEL0680]|nr:hypothetical protein HDU91_005159 [Kappamyces sp. JEL0680]
MQQIPRVGMGTYRISDSTEQLVYEAVRIGYRHFDTAAVYRNEQQVGAGIKRAINDGLVARQDVWVTTKIAPKDQGYEKCRKAIDKRLEELDVTYIDLLLLHWPGSQGLKPDNPKNKDNRIGSLLAMHESMKTGRIKRIGVSNFNQSHFEGLEPYLQDIFCNQIELHPLLWTPETQALLAFLRSHNIKVQAYSSLGEGRLLDAEQFPELQDIALRNKTTIATVLIAWALDKGFIVMPKSSSVRRLQENFDAAEIRLPRQDLDAMDALVARYGETKFCWDPSRIS